MDWPLLLFRVFELERIFRLIPLALRLLAGYIGDCFANLVHGTIQSENYTFWHLFLIKNLTFFNFESATKNNNNKKEKNVWKENFILLFLKNFNAFINDWLTFLEMSQAYPLLIMINKLIQPSPSILAILKVNNFRFWLFENYNFGTLI